MKGLTRLRRWSPGLSLGSGAILGQLSFPYLGGASSGACWLSRDRLRVEKPTAAGVVLNVSSACYWLWKSL